jgi:GT2 family glycosyltransferase
MVLTDSEASRRSQPSVSDLNRVTIVVPVYGHWESLRACVVSLIEHADPRDYDVILVNDCGPDADEIEAGLIALTFGHSHIRYERNADNLGFVRTCNRAAYELDTSGNDLLLLNSDAVLTAGALDELRSVLSLSDHHGVVCARSNDATIATLPFLQRNHGTPRDSARTQRVFDAINQELPRYYVSPVAIGFCFLIRRSLIDNHGLFDEIYGRGYNEENDFCMRINALGYSSLIANHALVHHVGSTSFGAEQRNELELANSRILLERYPHYTAAVSEFVAHGYDIVDRFCDLIVDDPSAKIPKILIDLHHISLHWDGSSRNAITFIEHLSGLHSPGAEITIAAPADAIEFFDLRQFGLRVIDYSSIAEPFDVGFALAPVTALGQLTTLNRFCLRWAVSFLDIIALRSWELRMLVPWKVSVVRAALTHADRIIAISRGTVDDAVNFFPELSDALHERAVILHQGSAASSWDATVPLSSAVPANAVSTIQAGGYAFVLGNGFPHKQIPQALTALSDLDIPTVSFGDAALAERYPDAVLLAPGTLSDNDIAAIYANASAVVFPTAYEGFGLPLAEAAQYDLPVVAFDTNVAREVVSALGLDANVTYFTRFDELAEAVSSVVAADAPTSPREFVRTMADYNAELWESILASASEPVDLDDLRQRERALRDLSAVGDAMFAELHGARSELQHIKTSRAFTLAQAIARSASSLRRVLGRPRPSDTGAALNLRDYDRS